MSRHDSQGSYFRVNHAIMKRFILIASITIIIHKLITPESELEYLSRESVDEKVEHGDAVRQQPSSSNSICSLFSSSSSQKTASHVWQRHLHSIYNASHHPDMPDWNNTESNKKMKSILLDQLVPSRLRRGIRSMPSTAFSSFHSSNHNDQESSSNNNHNNNDNDSVAYIMKIVHERIAYLKQKNTNHETPPEKEARPLQIVVLGGSVTAGRGCWPGRSMTNKKCAWPRRFEFLINQLLGKSLFGNKAGTDNNNIVEVHNIAMGGISSHQGTTFVKYWMYPQDSALQKWGPDIIINSFSTNDALPPWGETEDVARKVYSGAKGALEAFVRVALQIRSPLEPKEKCTSIEKPPPPLVVFVDDYVGHQQDSVLGELSYNTAMVQIANWYQSHTMAISYADVIRDLVYQNTHETTFSAQWYPNDRRTHKPKFSVEVHFGHYGHISIAWVLAFGVLELVTQYCGDLENLPRDDNHESSDSTNLGKRQQLTNNHNNILPPRLTDSLSLDKISQEWFTPPQIMNSSTTNNAMTLDCAEVNTSETSKEKEQLQQNANPCIMAWVAGPVGLNANGVNQVMRQYSTRNDGWKVETDAKDGWKQKIGWVATKAEASFVMELPNVSKDVHVISLMYMKSYGEKWKDSRVKITILGSSNNTNTTTELRGSHEPQVSIAFTEEIHLTDPVLQHSNLQLHVELVGGTTFKVLGLMVCAW